MAGKKLIPFPCEFKPRFDHSIDIGAAQLKVIHRGDLHIEKDNPLIGIYFFAPFDKDNQNRLIVRDVFHDPTDNTMAIRIKGIMNIIDYEKCKTQIEK